MQTDPALAALDPANPWDLDDAIDTLLSRYLPPGMVTRARDLIARTSTRDTAYVLGQLKAHGAITPAVLDGLCDHIIGTGADHPHRCQGWWQTAADKPEPAS